MSDPCSVATKAYTDFYIQNADGECNLDNNNNINLRDKYCSDCVPKYDSLLSAAKKACGSNLDPDVNLNYDYIKYAKNFFCTKDSNTGEWCDAVYIRGFDYKIPYNQWDASICKSSCVAQIDQGIREVIDNQKFCENYSINPSLFKNNANPVSSCGKGGNSGAVFSGSVSDNYSTINPGNNTDTDNVSIAGTSGVAGSTGGTTGGSTGGTTGGTTGVSNASGSNGVAGSPGVTRTGITGVSRTTTSRRSSFPTINSNATSDATSISANIYLLSLIICLIYALLK